MRVERCLTNHAMTQSSDRITLVNDPQVKHHYGELKQFDVVEDYSLLFHRQIYEGRIIQYFTPVFS